MRLLEQLELTFENIDPVTSILSLRERRTTKLPGEGKSNAFPRNRDLELGFVGQALRLPVRDGRAAIKMATDAVALQLRGRDVNLEREARELLIANGAARIAGDVRVEWNPRLKSSAGRADYREKLISLNPQLREHPHEIDRTFRHELAHLLAQFRASRRRILPHGSEWSAACVDLGIGDEKRCHNLPFPFIERAWRFLYKCPHCKRNFPRVRKIRRAIACLVCCRKHNGGDFDPRFRLRLAAQL
ncbi:MAG TPA: SprT-like domain-containing protein [Chthoniobacterales bacterium]|jgi:predicted SprT family Zn-dependent metalloprotease|nr:SprT-like domain-containing protein [Chthoniobacterales bacterium]